MSKQFWIFLAVGVAVVAIALSVVWFGTASSHLELNGKILKVRTLALGQNASLVAVDFRVTNPSGVPFVVSDVTLKLVPATGPEIDGAPASRTDIDSVFQDEKLIGPRFNDVLTLQDKIPPNKTLDRMTAARFEIPESQIDQRKSLSLRLQDLDGTVVELKEEK
ncbi:MAG TPA: hypothetical protein VH639_14590 [Bryobacteraceae bacterium]|jgi:hypothetical protein